MKRLEEFENQASILSRLKVQRHLFMQIRCTCTSYGIVMVESKKSNENKVSKTCATEYDQKVPYTW